MFALSLGKDFELSMLLMRIEMMRFIDHCQIDYEDVIAEVRNFGIQAFLLADLFSLLFDFFNKEFYSF